MSLAQQIRDDFKTARILRDARTGFYSTVVGEIEKIEKAAFGEPAADADVLTILRKFRKNIDDTLKLPGLAPERIEAFALEGRWIAAYLPKMLEEPDLRRIIGEIAGAQGIQLGASAMGKIMPTLTRDYAGQFDGRLAAQIIKES